MPEAHKYRGIEEEPKTKGKNRLGSIVVAAAVMILAGVAAKQCASCLSEDPERENDPGITESCNPGRTKKAFPRKRLIPISDAESWPEAEAGLLSIDDPRTPLQKACERLAYAADGGSEEIYASLQEVGTVLSENNSDPKAKMKAIKEIIEACGISEEDLLKVLVKAINQGTVLSR